MAILDILDLESLENEAEQIVLVELERQLKSRPKYVCTCKVCMLDVMAFALNSIKPLYRVSLLGKMYTGAAMEERAYAASVRDAVFTGIEKVHRNPSHSQREVKEEKEEATPNQVKQKKSE